MWFLLYHTWLHACNGIITLNSMKVVPFLNFYCIEMRKINGIATERVQCRLIIYREFF